MDTCGLVGCTPSPTVGPTGLTHLEALALGQSVGTLIGFSLIATLVFLVVLVSLVTWTCTRD